MACSTELLVGFCVLAAPAMGWLFYSGFIFGRPAGLVWQGAVDVERLGILSGAAVCGVATRLWIQTTLRRPGPPRAAAAIDLGELRAAPPLGLDVRNYSDYGCASLRVAAAEAATDA